MLYDKEVWCAPTAFTALVRSQIKPFPITVLLYNSRQLSSRTSVQSCMDLRSGTALFTRALERGQIVTSFWATLLATFR